jgi:5'-nucleotidase (lipoprotein e(P4) family)
MAAPVTFRTGVDAMTDATTLAATRRALLALALVLTPLTGACATAGGAAPADRALPAEVHWVRTSAEYHALFLEVYRWAGDAVAEAAARRQPGTWAVILDVDETVLDNSEYQAGRARQGLGFTNESWNEWVREEAATALPGARRFVDDVRSRGGRVVLVTNRDEVVCDPTRRNLEAVDVRVDLVLCRRPGPSEKESRFRSVEDGTASDAFPALEVVAWVGDNIHDFPGGSQALRNGDPVALAAFGQRYFVLPNPMYGSWESNPPN